MLEQEHVNPIVISFYTLASPYQLEALNLLSSCNQFSLDCHLEGIESRGSWEDNCAYKPFFILEKLKQFKRPLFWMDADAVFIRTPSFAQFQKADLAVRLMERFVHDIRFYLCTASMFWNYTPKAIELLEKWCARCQVILDQGRPAAFLEQVFLLELIREEKGLNLYSLPAGYCKIFDLDHVQEEEIVVEQRQASRRFREFVNG